MFSASFDRNRFEQLIANLRFDSREGRDTNDKLYPFDECWNSLLRITKSIMLWAICNRV